MSYFHEGPRVYGIAAHGINKINLRRDPERQCLEIVLTGIDTREFTITVYTDAPNSVPDVITTDVTHELEEQSM